MEGAFSSYCCSRQCQFLASMILLIVFVIVASPSTAVAHRVYVYAWVEGNKVYTESYFSSGDRVRKGLIQVYSPDGKKLVEGRTNDKGEFSFAIPQRTDLRIVLNAAMGHKGEYVLKAEELGGGTSKKTEKTVSEKVAKKETMKVNVPSTGISEEKIRIIVEKALDARLKPIARSIALLREEKGPGVTEVVGGIGYIIGLMGVVLYVKGRKKAR